MNQYTIKTLDNLLYELEHPTKEQLEHELFDEIEYIESSINMLKVVSLALDTDN